MFTPLIDSLREVGFTKPYLLMLNVVLGCLAIALCWVYYMGLGDQHVTVLGCIALLLGMSLNWMAMRQRPQSVVDKELGLQGEDTPDHKSDSNKSPN